jgi:hypothetical protein
MIGSIHQLNGLRTWRLWPSFTQPPRNRVAQVLGKTTVDQIVEIVSAHRPARKMHSACRQRKPSQMEHHT